MDIKTIELQFESQLKDIKLKIIKLTEELSEAKEYKLKLIGGLETLLMIQSNSEESDKLSKEE